MTSTQRSVLIAGATGRLGSRIAHGILDAGGTVRLLVRSETPSDNGKKQALRELTERGAQIVIGDLVDRTSLDRATTDVSCVVSALQGGPEVIIAGQVSLAEAAAANGVRRFIPSDFSVDLFQLPEGSHPNLDMRRAADRAIGKMPIEQTNVLNGGFMEVVFAPFFQMVDVQNATVSFYGEADTPLDVTTVADTARFTARAALEDSPLPGPFAVAGDVVTADRLRTTLSQIHGKQFTLQRKGSIADLEAWIQGEQAAGRAMAWPTLGAQYAWAMMSGRARIEHPVNVRYPEIAPTTVAQFFGEQVTRQPA